MGNQSSRQENETVATSFSEESEVPTSFCNINAPADTEVLPSVPLPEMEEKSWTQYCAEFGAKVAAKVMMNMVAPGLGSFVEFGHGLKCFLDGDITDGVINMISGGGDLISLGLMSIIKDAMRKSAKAAVIETVKEMTKSAPKEVTKKLGRQVRKEIAKGVLNETSEEVWRECTKMTVKKAGPDAILAAISSGGRQVGKTVFEDLSEKFIFELMEKNTKKGAFQFFKHAAKEGTRKEFEKRSYKLIGKDVCISVAKGTLNYLSADKYEYREGTKAEETLPNSDIQLPTSDFQHRTDFRTMTTNLRQLTSDVGLRTLDFQSPTSEILPRNLDSRTPISHCRPLNSDFRPLFSDLGLPTSEMRLPTWFFGFRFDFNFRIGSSAFGLPTSDFRLGIPNSGFGLPTSNFTLLNSDFRLPTSDFRFPSFGFRL